tara:strand:+ start:315 stop:533 length:219 start_codon:yes stop_codon:yes gene_type:complete
MKKINKVKINLNGKNRFISSKMSLKSLLNNNKIPINKVAIEINKEIINKKKISKIKLKNGDKVEIVHFIGGG